MTAHLHDEGGGEFASPVVGSARPSNPSVGTSEGERELQKQVMLAISDVTFPATRDDLLRHIGPDQRGTVQARLRMLLPDVGFASAEAVIQSFGGISTSA
jgi:hypothetical protein